MSGKNGTAGALAVVRIAQIASWSCDGRSRAPISIGRPAAASNIVKRLAKLGAIIVRPSGVKSRSEEHTSELQSLMRISYAVFCLKKKNKYTITSNTIHQSNKHNNIH